MFCSFYPAVVITETDHTRSRSIAFLKNWENCFEASIMKSKNLFPENLQTAVDFSISENETVWTLQ